MPVATPNVQLQDSPGNTTFTVTVAAAAAGSVQVWADASGQTILATVAPGATSATFYAPAGYFYVVCTAGSAGFTFTATQSFLTGNTISEFMPSRGINSPLTNSTLGIGTVYFVPFDVPQVLSAYRLNVYASIATALSALNSTGSAGLTLSAAIYSRGAASATASSDNIYSFWSGSQFVSFSNSSNSNLTVAQPAGISASNAVSSISTTLATANASTWLATSVGGFREFVFPVSSLIQPGRYWFALQYSQAAATSATFNVAASILQETYSNQIAWQPWGTNSSASNVSFPNILEGMGAYTATTTAFPGTIPLTAAAITAAPIQTAPIFAFSAYTTNLSEL